MKWPCCLRLPEGRRPGPGDGASRGIDCKATGGMGGVKMFAGAGG
jgi:hypothetical protein